MTTQRDLDTAAEVSLTICDACGWHALMDHRDRCRPDLGRSATHLIEAVPDARAGKLGYGDQQVVFDLTKRFSVRFDVNAAGSFTLRDVYLLDDLSHDDAAALVRVLKDWMDTRCGGAR